MFRIICLVSLTLLLTNELYAQSKMNHGIKDMQLFQTTREEIVYVRLIRTLWREKK